MRNQHSHSSARESFFKPYTRGNKMASGRYLVKEEMKSGKFQIVLYNPLKKRGYVPGNGSEIYVSSIPEIVDEWELAEFFNKAGEIFLLRLMMTEDWVRNRGFAYVTFMNSEKAKEAINVLENLDFMGNKLTLEISLNNCRIFISGFPTDKTKDQVWLELKMKGVKNIVDVIMYRSYSNRAENRGFVFVEFMTHEQAASARAKFANNLKLFGREVVVDWSVPIPEIDNAVLNKVKILYLRNLDVTQSPENFRAIMSQHVRPELLEKVYKFKNYAFVHLTTRNDAEILMEKLKVHYKDTIVDVEWARPTNKYTTAGYRLQKVSTMSQPSRSRSVSSSSFRSDNNSSSSSPSFAVEKTPNRPLSESSDSSSEEMQVLQRENKILKERLLQHMMNSSANASPSQDYFRGSPIHGRPQHGSHEIARPRPIYPTWQYDPLAELQNKMADMYGGRRHQEPKDQDFMGNIWK